MGSKVVVDLRELKSNFPKLPLPDSVCGVITVINQCCWWISLDDDATFDHFKELIWANRELQQWVSTPFGRPRSLCVYRRLVYSFTPVA